MAGRITTSCRNPPTKDTVSLKDILQRVVHILQLAVPLVELTLATRSALSYSPPQDKKPSAVGAVSVRLSDQ